VRKRKFLAGISVHVRTVTHHPIVILGEKNMATRRRVNELSLTSSRLRAALALNRLEQRTLLTSTLYVDFGDNFPVGGFTLTNGQFGGNLGSGGSGGLSGPGLGYASTELLRFLPASQRVTFDYNGSGGVNAQDWIDLRAATLAMVQRYYEPFDVNVVMAPVLNNTSSATYFADIQAQLNAGPAVTGERDCWVFSVYGTVASSGVSIGLDGGFYGIASGRDIGLNNANDDSCLVAADRVFANFGNANADTAFAYTTAHEAAHNFGLRHTSNVALSNSDVIVSSAGTTNRTNFNHFTRYPLSIGAGTANNHDRYASTGVLGLNSNAPVYVTGTGEHDIITLTRTSATTASVTVQAFTNATYTTPVTVPGIGGTTYSYTLTFNATNGILIDSGFDNDRIIIDGTLSVPIRIRGMGSTDQLIVNGGGAATGSFTPNASAPVGYDGNASFGGTLVVGSTTINILEFEAASTIEVNGVTTFTHRTPNAVDNVTVDTVIGGRFRVTGTSGGVTMIPLIADATNLIVDTATNDTKSGNDTITVLLAGVVAAGRSVSVDSGLGADTVNIQSLAASTILSVSAGAGNDTIRIDSNGAAAGGTVNNILGGIGVNGQDGTDTLILDDTDDATNDVLTVDDTKIGIPGDTYFGTGGSVQHSGLETINIDLTSSATGDVINLIPSVAITYTIDGNAPTTPGTGDRLNLDLAGVTNPLNTPSSAINGVWTFGNRQPVNYISIEEQGSSVVPPSVIVDDGTQQRILVRELTVVFDRQIGFVGTPEAAFTLERISGGMPVGNVTFIATPAVVGGVTEVTINFTSDVNFGSLVDGRYRLTVIAAQLTGITLGSDVVSDFHRMYGDFNGDAQVDGFDFGAFSSTSNLSSPSPNFLEVFDLNGDGNIDGFEFSQFSGRFNTILP
jgi:hypothetical protein